jgi:hypothetical protein
MANDFIKQRPNEIQKLDNDASKKSDSVKSFKLMEKDWRMYLALFRAKPDLFLDFIKDPNSTFFLFFYQRIILRIIFQYRITYLVFARGSSKSFLQILALYLKCIFYPRLKLTITSPQKIMSSQIAQQNLEQIWEFFPILKNECKQIRFEKDYTKITFHNGAVLDCVSLSESSRGLRRNGLSIEELVHEKFDEDTLNSVIMPIMANNRKAMNGLEDHNELHKPVCYVTTAGIKQSYAYSRHMEVLRDMVQGKSAFVLGANFELACMHELLSLDYIQELKESSNFNVLSFGREYESIWTGSNENSLISLEDFRKCRTLTNAETKAMDKNAMYILSYDCARAEGNQNATSALAVFRCVDRGDGTYQKHCVNLISMEGTHFLKQSLFLKKMVHLYNASALVVDANGIGSAVVDNLVLEIDEFPPFEVINDDRYNKYKTNNSIPMVFAIKSQAKETRNSDIHNHFMTSISNHQVKFLISESEARSKIKKKSAEDLNQALLPYIYTDLLEEELMNLEYSVTGTQTKIKQISKGINKDRFSAIEYGLFYIHLLEKKNQIRRDEVVDISNFFMGRRASCGLKGVRK